MCGRWDKLYIELAERYSKESSCLRRSVGAVITVDNRLVVAGYNGAPSGVKSCRETKKCLRENCEAGENLQNCLASHAEQNAITQAAKMGIRIDGGTLYCTHSPCSICAKIIISCGIKRIVYKQEYPDNFAFKLLNEAGVVTEKYE